MPSRDPYGRKGRSLNEMLNSSQSATVNTVNGYSNSSPVSLKSSPMNSSNVLPNTSHITQNSSLASSAILKSATSSSAGATVLGKLLNVINYTMLEVFNCLNERLI